MKKPFKGYKRDSCPFLYTPRRKGAFLGKILRSFRGITKFETSLVLVKCNRLVASCYKVCKKLVGNNIVTALSRQSCYKSVNNLLRVRHNNLCEQILQQARWNKLATNLLQVSFNLCVVTRVFSTRRNFARGAEFFFFCPQF